MDLLQWRDRAQVTSAMGPGLDDDPKAIAAFLAATSRLQHYDEGSLVVERALGSGTSFEVFACRDANSGGMVAVKRPRFPHTTYKTSSLVNRTVLRELKIAAYPPLLQHQNIAHVLGFENITRVGSNLTLSLVSEFSEIGSLAQFFEETLPFSVSGWAQKFSFATDVASGLEVLHACRIVHSDMKPENVLLFRSPCNVSDAPLMAKISDFGNAIVEETLFVEDTFKRKREYRGTPMYTAPFVLDTEGNIPFHFMPKADIYSFGLLAWSIFKGQHFFLSAGEKASDERENISPQHTAQNVMTAFKSFVQEIRLALPANERMRIERTVEACIVGPFDFEPSVPSPIILEQTYRKAFSAASQIKKLLQFGLTAAMNVGTEDLPVQQPFILGSYIYSAADDVPWNLQTQLRLELLSQIENTQMTKFQKGRAALKLSACSATGFGCKKDIISALDYFNLAATFENISAQLLIHRVFDAHGQPSPVLDTKRLAIYSETGSERSDYEPDFMAEDSDDEGEDDYEMQTSISPEATVTISEPSSRTDADDLNMMSSELLSNSEDDTYATFHLGAAMNREFYKQAINLEEWYCWNARLFTHRCLAEAFQEASLFLLDQRYLCIKDPALLSKALELCSTESCPTVQFRYMDKTRGEVPILHYAVAAGEIDVVKALIDNSTNVDMLDLDGKTPLLLAAEYGHREITEFLIGRGAKATISSPSGQFPLHRLWMYDNDDVQVIAKRLVREAGANVNASMKKADSVRDVFYGFQVQGTALHAAISMRSPATVTALLEVGADVNAQPYDTLPSPLELAAINHTPEIVQLLLDHGAKLALDSTHGSWALHEVGRHLAPLQRWLLHGIKYMTAASETIQILLKAAKERGIDPNSLNDDGLTAIEAALEEPGEDGYLIEAFLDNGFRLPESAVLHAVLASSRNEFNNSNLDMVLALGARLEILNDDGLNALHFSAQYGALGAAQRILQEEGADILGRQKDNEGKTPLHWSARKNHCKVLELLISHGAELDVQDNDGISALGLAIEKGSTECIICLLRKGAQIMVQQGQWAGSSVLIFAVLKDPEDSKSMLSFLLSGNLNEDESQIFPQFHVPDVLNARDTSSGDTVLHRAAAVGDYEGVFSLLRAGASPSLRNLAGRTPWESARLRLESFSAPVTFKDIVLRQRLETVLSHIKLHENGSDTSLNL